MTGDSIEPEMTRELPLWSSSFRMSAVLAPRRVRSKRGLLTIGPPSAITRSVGRRPLRNSLPIAIVS